MNFFQPYILAHHICYLKTAVDNSWAVKVAGFGGIHDVLKTVSFLVEANNIVLSIHNDIIKWIEITENYEYNEALVSEDKHSLKNDLIVWNDRIKNEFLSIPVICLYTEGILNYKRLQGGAEKFFKKETWECLSITAKSDLDDAAKCLLCELPTPSVMISLRAVEDVLRQYYGHKTKQHPERKGWKDILNELLSINAAGNHKYDVNKKLMGLLDYIRENERNVAEHPDKRFGQEEAEGIFSEVIKTITEISKDMV